MTDFFEYKEKYYPYKIIYFHTFSCHYSIATEDLERELLPDSEKYDSELARKIDEQIFFFVPNDIFKQTDKSIVRFIEENL